MQNLNQTTGLALFTDLYELTMLQGYHFYEPDKEVVFDMFFRRSPFGGGYAVFAGLAPLLDYITGLRFTDQDINYLKSLGQFKPEFLEYLADFRFTGDVYALEEGETVFPNEPLVRVHGNIREAQLLESALLNFINFQTLIATKAARNTAAAKGKAILEFGLRRAQGIDGAMSAARASYIGGTTATSNVLAGLTYGIPPKGTMAHSWVMSFDSEEESFEKYAQLYPDSTIILVDTYNTLETGMPAAVKVLKKLQAKGITNTGVRLDSGDLDYLSRKARAMLN
ncbi:MAG: nicotinate phosphoribosyltransferase, partial [bacterium]|nr:nicotinate phosphoribosyltransferase [bacterium]